MSHNSLIKLDISENKEVTQKGASYIGLLLRNKGNVKLEELILNNIALHDSGIQNYIAHSLYDKFKLGFEEEGTVLGGGEMGRLPLTYLSLSGVQMGDQGLISLVHLFENIMNTNKSGSGDYINPITIDISYNLITDHGLKVIAQLLRKFAGIKHLYATHLS